MFGAKVKTEEKITIEHRLRGTVSGSNWSFTTPPLDAMRLNGWYINEISNGARHEDIMITHDKNCWCGEGSDPIPSEIVEIVIAS